MTLAVVLFLFFGLLVAIPVALAGDMIARRHVAADPWGCR